MSIPLRVKREDDHCISDRLVPLVCSSLLSGLKVPLFNEDIKQNSYWQQDKTTVKRFQSKKCYNFMEIGT